MTIYVWREGNDKYFYKTKIQPRVCLKVLEWEHENYLEERELEALSMDKDETLLEWLDPSPQVEAGYFGVEEAHCAGKFCR